MKSLVIYYSHTGENYMRNGIENIEKGNTEIVAEKIKEITDADLFKVETVNDYPYDYHECCDVAKEELEKEARPKLKKNLENFNSYNVIYIGGPVWWGHYPMAIFSLLEGLDFSGKEVYPFTTHEGSGLGSVMDDVRKLCVGADIKSGIAIRGCDANNALEKLESWCK